jgi:hypothetical protein
MIQDPIVEEVRAIREQLAATVAFDIRKIVEDARNRQAISGSRIVSFERPNQAPQSLGPTPTVSGNMPPLQAGPTESS